MTFISLGSWSSNILFIYVGMVFYGISNIITFLAHQNYNFFRPFFFVLLVCIGNFIAGSIQYLFNFVIIPLTQRQTPEEAASTNESIISSRQKEFLKKKPQQRNSKRNLLFIISSILEYSSFLFFTIPIFSINNSNLIQSTRIYHIFFSCILGYFVLHYRVYRHQLFSIGAILLGYILICIPSRREELGPKTIFYIIILIFASLIGATKDVIDKVLMESFSILPSDLLFCKGSIMSIIAIIVLIVVNFIKLQFPFSPKEDNGYLEIFSVTWNACMKDKILWLFIFIFFVCNSIFYYCLVHVNFYYTPAHINISEAVSNFFVIGFFLILDFQWFNILKIIGLTINLLSCFVYNDIIILNFCGLNENTKDSVSNRGEIEMKNEDLDISKENNTTKQ